MGNLVTSKVADYRFLVNKFYRHYVIVTILVSFPKFVSLPHFLVLKIIFPKFPLIYLGVLGGTSQNSENMKCNLLEFGNVEFFSQHQI